MEANRAFTLQLPKPQVHPPQWEAITSDGPIVIIGGNGVGKTRLGALLDLRSPRHESTHRIAAQRALVMPQLVQAITTDAALKALLYGSHQGVSNWKDGHRWGGQAETSLLNDYERLMVYLFAEDWEVSTRFRQEAQARPGALLPPPITKLDIVKRVWENTLPYRRLVIGGGKIEVGQHISGSSLYPGPAMSDGERVIIYLIGQALSAPPNGILVIDEPEIHLHKAIQARLWDNIEAERPDCLFVYLTHDLDFAATRRNAKKICIKSYDGKAWDWFEIPTDSELPEEVLLQLLGSRKPVLFVEGEKNSLDYQVYQHVYTSYTVMPRGSCDAVLHSTATFTALKNLHNLECFGIVDRDEKSEEDIRNLAKANVRVLRVAEVENLFLTEEVLRVIASRLSFPDPEKCVAEAKAIVLKMLGEERERVVSALVGAQIERLLKNLNRGVIGAPLLRNSLDSLHRSIDVEAMYKAAQTQIGTVIQQGNYAEALRLFSYKGLLPAVAHVFNQNSRGLRDYIGRIIVSKQNADMIAALKKHLPAL